MTQPLSDLFSYYGRRANQFFLHELEEMLCPAPNDKSGPRTAPLAIDTARKVAAGTGEAGYSLQKSADGQTLTLEAHIRRGGQSYDTQMTAVKVRSDNLYEIRALTFDNKAEKLNHRWEITSVLSFIGRNHLQNICENKVPEPHQERGQFGKIGRFFNRCLLDNPHMMMRPPGL